MSLNKSKGLITSEGIIFDNRCYTCSLAIKEQWFEKVRMSGPIEVEAYTNSNDVNEIVLLMNVGFVCCNLVEHDTCSFDRNEYFNTLQQLRQETIRNKK